MADTNYSALAGNLSVSPSGSSLDARVFINKTLIMLAKYYLRFWDVADHQKLPSNSSKSMQFSKYPDLSLPTATLTEGSDPNPRAMSNTYVTATCEQWGDVVKITDVAELTIAHPVMSIAQDLLARQAARTIDRELQVVLNAGTNIYYAGNVAGRSSLTTSTKMTASEARAITAKLRQAGAEPFDGEFYVGICDPAVEAELYGESTFINANSYAGNLTPLMNGEIGKWMGIRWIRSNFIASIQNSTAPTVSKTSGGSLTAGDWSVILVKRLATTDQIVGIVKESATVTTETTNLAIALTVPTADGYVFDAYVGAPTGVKYPATTTAGSAMTRLASGASATILSSDTAGVSIADTDIPADNVIVHNTYVFGRGAFACVDLQPLTFHMTPNSPQVGNVLLLARYAGWKTMFKGVILNNDFMYRVESHSAY